MNLVGVLPGVTTRGRSVGSFSVFRCRDVEMGLDVNVFRF